MKNFLYRILLVLLPFFGFQFMAFSQAPLRFSHYTTQDGLPSNLLTCVAQDQKGFLWFGSDEGISRFDGYSFTEYKNLTSDTNSLCNNVVNNIFCDSKGRLWIATSEGLSLYLPQSDLFKSFFTSDKQFGNISGTHIIFQVTEDKFKRLWVNTDRGIIIIDSTGTNAEYLTSPDKELNNFFNHGVDYVCFHKNQVWAGSAAMMGMRVFDLNTLKDYTSSLNEAFRDSAFNIKQILIEGDSVAWLAKDDGFFRYNLITGANKKLFKTGDTHIEFSYAPSSIMLDSKNNLWASFNFQRNKYSSIAKVNRADLSLEFFTYNELDPRGLTWAHCLFIFEDNRGLFWIGTSRGLNLMNPAKQEIQLIQQAPDKQYNPTDNLYAVARSGNKIWLGTDGDGLFSYDVTSRKFEQMIRPTGEINEGIYVVQPIKDDKLLIGAQSGYLFEFSLRSGELKKLLDKPATSNSLFNNISCIVTADSIHFWIGYMGCGFILYDIKNNSFKSFRHDPGNSNSPSSDQVNSIVMDPKGYIWIGYSDGTNIFTPIQGTGIDKYDPATGKFTHYHSVPADPQTISSNNVTALRMDKNGNLWIGTKLGLNKMKTENGKCTRYLTADGMPFENIASLEIDHDGNIWVASWVNGIACIRAENGSIIHFDKSDGLQDLRFNRGASYTDAEGRIYFAGVAGLNLISPSNISLRKSTAPVYITQININAARYISDTATYDLKNLSLKYNQSDIEFQFVALDYDGNKNIIYEYQLEGYEDKWNPGDLRSAKYTNLDPDHYIFHVRTINKITGETGETVSLQIDISPPFYKTTWFRIFAGILIASLIYSIFRMRTSSLRRQKYALEKTVQERTQELIIAKERAEKSEEFKQQFLANMSHEIRTPMNAVSGMTDLLIEKNHLPEQEKYLAAIQKSSESLLHIINDILDLSKVEAGKLELESIDFSIHDLAEETIQIMKIKADEKGLLLISHVDDDLREFWLGDPHRIKQILINLLGNAIKFTEKGSVELRLEKPADQNQGIHFRIIDTGIGIAEDKIESVFESFKQAQSSDSRKYGGTGLGLSISKQLIELQGGQISVNSKIGEGTEFMFDLPLPAGSEINYKKHSSQLNSIDATSLNGLRILLADDNEYNRIVAVDTLLSKADVLIDQAVNGLEVIQKLRVNDYDLILMDVQMPEMSGFEATQIIRNEFDPPKNNIPVIALTASVLKTDLDKCRQSGMNSYVPKPFKAAILLNEIALLTGRNIIVKKETETFVLQSKISDGVTNLNFLRKFTEGDHVAMRKYIRIYLEKTRQHIEMIKAAEKAGDMEQIKLIVHTMKAHFRMMGMKSANELAILIEENIERQNTDLHPMLDRFYTICNQSIEELEQ